MGRRWLGLALLAAALAADCSTIRTLDTAGVPTMTLAELEAAEPGTIAPDRQATIVRIPAGTEVPVRFDIRVPFGTLVADGDRWRFDREIFFYMGPAGFFVSPDAARWAIPGDTDALKELFGWSRGTFQIGFGVHADEGAALNIGVTAE